MAIRIRKDCAKQFQVYWTNPFTKKRESVFCATLPEAQKTDAQIKYRLQWEKDTFKPADEPAKEEVSDTSFGGVVYAYLQEKQFDKAGVTNTVSHMRRAVEAFGHKDINDVSEQELNRLLIDMSKSVKTITVVALMKHLRTIFRWAFKRKILRALPEWPELPHAEYEHFVPPTQDEIARMLMVASPHIQRVIIVGSRIGVRIGQCELFKLKWSDVDWSKGSINIPAAKKNLAEPIREVPISRDLMPLFESWYAEDVAHGTEYIISWKGKQMHYLHRAWWATLRRAGITRRIRPYDLRHAFATELIAGGADVGTVALLMGHTDTSMVFKHYQHVLTKQKIAAIECIPPLPEMSEMCHGECATVLQ